MLIAHRGERRSARELSNLQATRGGCLLAHEERHAPSCLNLDRWASIKTPTREGAHGRGQSASGGWGLPEKMDALINRTASTPDGQITPHQLQERSRAWREAVRGVASRRTARRAALELCKIQELCTKRLTLILLALFCA
jgi:hypothetical protein